MKEEAREPRQEAVVKGITPAQPAPMPVERVTAEPPKQDNWLDKVLGWFRSKPAAPVAAPVKAEVPRRGTWRVVAATSAIAEDSATSSAASRARVPA